MEGGNIIERSVLKFDLPLWERLQKMLEGKEGVFVERYVVEAVREKLKRDERKGRVCRILRFEPEKEGNGDWVRVYYKVPRGRKVYSCFVRKLDVMDGKVNLPWFKGEER